MHRKGNRTRDGISPATLAIGALFASTWLGCSRTPASVAKSPEKTVVADSFTPAATELDDSEDVPTDNDATSMTEALPVAELATTEATETIAEEAATIEEGPPSDHRIWLPTSAGPIVIDVDIRIDDLPLAESFNRWIDTVLSEIYRAEDSLPTWDSFLDHVQSSPERFSDSVARSADSPNDVIRRYDLNRNGTVENKEAAKFLFQASQFASPFRVFGTMAMRHVNRNRSPIWMLIKDDPAGGATKLAPTFDRNGDARIDLNEVAGDRIGESQVRNIATRSAWDRRQSHRRGDVAMDLDGHIDWSSLSYAIDRDTVKTVWPNSLDLHHQLDTDASGTIDAEEAEGLKTVAAHLRIMVEILNPNGAPEIKVINRDPSIESMLVTTDHPARVIIDGPKLRLIIEGVGPPTPQPMANVWKHQVRARAAEVPDAVFAWLDADNNRRLSQREVAALKSRMRSIDSVQAIPDTVIVQIGRGDPSQDDLLFSLARPISGGGADNLADDRPAWAVGMDANRDGDVSELEFMGPIEQFRRWDRNGDKFLDSDEIASGR
ncbi:hypothetical protein [Rubripirellula reticaptiva]|uniref:EF hand n=1 Tax=Rubripirellula reticaptiva TaxID=2528013 RepID=A0A5C6FAG7_9BACT|nr:hypothetical protein [Rubripirellula reticaptiva]TWU57792.1 EF hand [Rubripirellula reticaptiva]